MSTSSALSITPAAESDLEAIYDYHEPDVSDRIVDCVRDVSNTLLDMPHSGRARPELAPNLRSALADQYTVYYRPTENGIEIIRVIHQMRDIRPETFD
jgi:toxin ParE1/3/4